jgi:hypothetical protein
MVPARLSLIGEGGSRGSDPRPLGLTMGWLLNRTLGSDPVHQGSSMPEG